MNLDELRYKIDKIDEEIVSLLNKRANNAIEIGREKKKQCRPIRNSDREHDVLQHITRLNRGPLGNEAINAIYRQIISECSKVQSSE